MKYDITDETKDIGGVTLHRIVALYSFGDVMTGELGGFIEKDSNLSGWDDCWLYNDACAYDNAVVSRDAKMYDTATISSSAILTDTVKVFGSCSISGTAIVDTNCRLMGSVQIGGNNHITGDLKLTGTHIINTEMISIVNVDWPVFVYDTKLHIGCVLEDIEFLRTADDAFISELDPGALTWWNTYKASIYTTIDAART